MSNKGKRTLRAIVPYMVNEKRLQGDVPKTITSFISDASCILEALVAELDEIDIIRALDNQGFAGEKYVANLNLITDEAKKRRLDRKAGPLAKRVKA